MSTAERKRIERETEKFFYSILANDVEIRWEKDRMVVFMICSGFTNVYQLDRLAWVDLKIADRAPWLRTYIKFLGCMSPDEADEPISMVKLLL